MAHRRPLLRIQPRPPSSPPTEGQTTSNASDRVTTRTRAVIAAACESCRQRKVKCDGRRPRCLQCSTRGQSCRYLATAGETHSQAKKRKYEDLQNRLAIYEELFSFVATKSDTEAAEVWARIRNGDSPDAVLRYIHDADLLLQLHLVPDVHCQYAFPYVQSMPTFLLRQDNQYLESWLFKCSSFSERRPSKDKIAANPDLDPYCIPFHAVEIIDPRLHSVSAKRWTVVIDNDALLRELLQIFFLTEYGFFPMLQKDLFLQDMAAGRTRYCSPLLVNAILASACHGYAKSANRADFWDSRTLGYKFLAEARRLWDIEVENVQITTIQAAVTMSITLDAQGNDKIGAQYLQQAVHAANRIQLFSSSALQGEDAAMQNARAITAWGLFGLQAVHSFHVFSPPLLLTPPDIALPAPEKNVGFYGEFHLRYPLRKTVISVQCGTTIKPLSDFRAILNELAIGYFTDTEDDESTLNTIQHAWPQLSQWYARLPQTVDAKNISFPWHLKMHSHYQYVVICILETLSDMSTKIPKPRLYQTLRDAKIRFETLLRLHHLRHGYESYDIFILQQYSFLCFMHAGALGDAEPLEAVERRSSIALALKGLRDQGRNCYLGQLAFRFATAKLGAEASRLIQEITDDAEEAREKSMISQHVNSAWPAGIVKIVKDADSLRLGNWVLTNDEP